jgi:UDP-N-acetylglucosamine 1-carboxyvinyltransferase
MDVFRITGGMPLTGTVAAGGSKNAALPIMTAAILAHGPVTLWGVPDLVDVNTLALLLGHLGVEVKRQLGGEVRIETIDATPTTAQHHLVRRMRATFCVLGPLVARRGHAVVSLPGGCQIGSRPVDLHLKGLAALGTDIRVERGYVVARAKRLRGARVSLAGPHGPTVTGTANVMSAATLAHGHTTITGAAREPEIVDLGCFLNAMGAQIEGLGTSTLKITGVDQLGAADYRIIPDRIEAATLLIAAAMTRGSITVSNVIPRHLDAALRLLETAGAMIEVGVDRVALTQPRDLRPVNFSAVPYPGIPTDLQAQLMALATLARGISHVTDRVFPDRLRHVAELIRLGATFERRGARTIVRGVRRLTGTEVVASDLRASAALVLAGLAAQGTTTVRRIYHLDRGYEQLDRKLNLLGAQIQRLPRQEGARNEGRGTRQIDETVSRRDCAA